MPITLPTPAPVDEVSSIAPEDFRTRYVQGHRPLIVRNAVADWPAMQWSDTILAERLRGQSLVVDVMPPNADGTPDIRHVEFADYSVGAFIDAFSREDRYRYVLNQPVPPVLRKDLRVMPWASALATSSDLTLWWGRDRQRSSLHLDDNENLMCQFDGEKEFILFDPIDTDCLYVLSDSQGHTSAVDLHRNDLDRFPLLAQANPWIARIGPGDVLYVPCYWWHQVRSFGRHLAVSYLIPESGAQRLRLAQRLLDANALVTGVDEELRSLLASDVPDSLILSRLRKHHRTFSAAHGRSYYRHEVYRRLACAPLQRTMGGAAYRG